MSNITYRTLVYISNIFCPTSIIDHIISVIRQVNGFGAIPLYKFLKDKQGGGLGISAIKWNFTKCVRL